MAITRVQTSGKLGDFDSLSANASWTPGVAPAEGNLILCTFVEAGWSGWPGSNVHDSAGSPHDFTTLEFIGDGQGSYCGFSYLVVPSGGVTLPLVLGSGTGAPNHGWCVFEEFSGINSSTPFGTQHTSNADTGGATSGSSGGIDTGSDAGRVRAVIISTFGDVPANSGGGSWTEDITDTSGSYKCAFEYRTATVASQTGLAETWSWSGSHVYAAAIAAINQTAAVPVDATITQVAGSLSLTTQPVPSYGQFAVPIADVSAGNFLDQDSGTTLYPVLADVDDATYIISPATPNGEAFEITLGSLSPPVTGNITLRIKFSNTVDGGEMDYTFEFRQGSTTLQTFGPYAVSASTLSEADLVVTATITDWVTPFTVRGTTTQIA